MSNQTPPETEKRILEMTEPYPTYRYLRISGQLRLIGVGISPLHHRTRRLAVPRPEDSAPAVWLEQKAAASGAAR